MSGPVRLELPHAGGSTPILVGAGALARARAEVSARLAGRTVFAVTTGRVWELHGRRLEAAAASAARFLRLEVEEGEAAKRLAVAERLWREMIGGGGKRDSLVAAFGGGSVGDLAGFVAGAFLRGVPLVQIPSTLLAQVDSAIGGKSAIDLPEAKNSVGLFHQPELVVCDVELLATLPPEELRSGLFEVIKIAALVDRALFERLETDLERLLAADPAALERLVAAAVAAKIGVVTADLEDRDGRRVLNLGHTLGHAIEAALDYRRLRHGEAVGYGMLFAARLARRRGLPRGDAERLGRLIRGLGLPPLPPLPTARVLEAIGRDKKAREDGVAWVLLRGLGDGADSEIIGADEVAGELESFLEDPHAEP